jgi:hypothetical protein
MNQQTWQTPGGPHHLLSRLAGTWIGRTRTWLQPEGEPQESEVRGSIELVLEGRFALYLYQTSLDGEPAHGMFMFGFNTSLEQFEASWIDSFHNHTAIMFCTGRSMPDGFSVLGAYPDPTGGPDWGWRTEVQLAASDRLTVTAYNITPDGPEIKAVESVLQRAPGKSA